MSSANGFTETNGLPEYERASHRMVDRGSLAASFVKQIELTAGPRLDATLDACSVIDIGCGYGDTAAELATRCARVLGIEPNEVLARRARELPDEYDLTNLEIRRQAIGELEEVGAFDLAIMDNVLEHIADQSEALWRLSRCLKPGGAAFILVPNKLWPIEVHYRLPLLSYLPLPAANLYLRVSGRGRDYRDASYAPSFGRLRRLLAERPELDAQLTLPGDISLAKGSGSPIYRVGAELIRRFPHLWAVSKAFLVVAKKVPSSGSAASQCT